MCITFLIFYKSQETRPQSWVTRAQAMSTFSPMSLAPVTPRPTIGVRRNLLASEIKSSTIHIAYLDIKLRLCAKTECTPKCYGTGLLRDYLLAEYNFPGKMESLILSGAEIQ